MEEIIKQTLTAIPNFLISFFKMLASPRQFPLDKLPKDGEDIKESLVEALKFILISYVLIVIFNAWKSNSDNAFKDLGVVAVATLIQMSLFVFAIFLAWTICGSKRKFLEYFIIYSYNFGVVFIIISLFMVISDGYLKTFDRELYDNLLKVKSGGIKFNMDWWSNTNYQIAWGIIIVGYIIASIWGMIGWGAYRIINGSKKWKSFWVMNLAGFFSWIAFGISLLITSGLRK